MWVDLVSGAGGQGSVQAVGGRSAPPSVPSTDVLLLAWISCLSAKCVALVRRSTP